MIQNFRKKALATALIITTISTSVPAYANRDAGTIIGGILGGIFGHQIGRGSGRIGGAIVGGIVGAIIGNRVGRALEPEEYDEIQLAQRRAWRAAQDEPVYWRISRPGSRRLSYGSMRWIREGRLSYRGGRMLCREFVSEIYVSGYDVEVVHFHVCRDHNGRWVEIEDGSMIDYSRSGYPYDPELEEYYDEYDEYEPTTRPSSRPAPRPVTPPQSRPQPAPQRPSTPARPDTNEDTPEWIAGNSMVNPLIAKMKSAKDDKARIQLAAEFYQSWQNHKKFLTLDQLGRVVETFKNEKEKLRAVKLLRPVTDIRYGSTNSVLSKFSSKEAKDQARDLLK